MKIVIAPDSFKGSISAKDLCTAIKKGITGVMPNANVIEVPLADGGEGTMENLVYSTNGKIINVEATTDPLGRKINCCYGVLGDQETVIIEMAQVSGLPLLNDDEKNPLNATSFGTGELILHALDNGYRKFIIGLGGSATNDGGVGMLKALGVKLYDNGNQPLDDDVSSLLQLDSFDISGIDSRLKESSFIIASDVTNPLCGPNGASAIFGPQKGATAEMVKLLDASLNKYGEIIEKQFSINIHQIHGAGAAGGMGAALISFLNADVQSGIDITMQVTDFTEVCRDVDLIITGEGKLDIQTLSGKVIAGVSKIANQNNIPVIAVCGANELTGEQIDKLGLVAAFSIVSGPCKLEDAMKNAFDLASDCAEQIIRVLKVRR